MTISYTLADADGGTDILAVHDRLPRGLSAAENEADWRMSLEKLAKLVEQGSCSAGRGSERVGISSWKSVSIGE